MNAVQKRLNDINDELAELAERLPDEEARTLTFARNSIEDVRTSEAVAEMVNVAYHNFGGEGDAEATVSRLKEAA